MSITPVLSLQWSYIAPVSEIIIQMAFRRGTHNVTNGAKKRSYIMLKLRGSEVTIMASLTLPVGKMLQKGMKKPPFWVL
jgi:hypothetical protein